MAKVESATQELKKIERLTQKLKNNLHRADLNFTCQISLRSQAPGVVKYAVSMTAPAEGLAPLMFIGDNYEDLAAQLKSAIKNIDYDLVEKKYHEAQITNAENTIEGHKERLKELELPEEERGRKVVEGTKELPKNDKEDNEG